MGKLFLAVMEIVRIFATDFNKERQMKKVFLLLLSVTCLCIANAQDIIYTTDGQAIEARNIRQEGNAFRFNSPSIMDRSTYMIEFSRVKKIIYEDGHVEESAPFAKPQSTQPQPTTNTQPQEPVVQKSASRDTVFTYATLAPNSQLTPRLFNAYPPYKSPAQAFLYSFFLPGVGQMYNDEVGKGIIFLGVDIVTWGLFALTLSDGGSTPFIFGIIGAGIHIGAPIEAAVRAEELNQGHGYLALYPSLSKTYSVLADGETSLIPSMTLSFSF